VRFSFALVALCALTFAVAMSGTPRAAAQSPITAALKLPFPAGSAWKVIQGYNGGTHVPGPEQYALDLVRDGGPTGGADVVAPASGSVWFAHAPGAGNGCVSIKIDGGGGLIVQMCHIILHRALRPDEPLAAGAALGVVGPDGRVGNNGLAHMHLSLHRTPDYGQTRIPVPFALGGGLALEGLSLPADGTRNQYACLSANCQPRLTSTNGSSAPAPASSLPPVPAVAAGTSTPPPARPASPSAQTPPAPLGPLRVGIRAIVAGTGDCVNVRERPSLSAPAKACLPDGARLRLVEGPVSADGHAWWRLDALGWAVSQYLSPVPAALESNSIAKVNAGTDECLNLRAAPGRAAGVVTCLPDGTRIRLSGLPIEADGATWWQLEGRGWAVAEFLTPED